MKITKALKRLSTLLMLPLLASAVMANGNSEIMETVGPQGEKPTSYEAVQLAQSDKDQIKKGNYKAAILMHTTSDFSNALIAGAKDVFSEVGIDVVVTTDAGMDPNKQRTDAETTLALKPDIILTLVLDPVSGAAAFKMAQEQGVKLVFLSNLPNGYVHGKDYVGIVTDDLFSMGKSMAELMADSLGGKGKVALMYHEANYYVTNQRDRAVKTVLKHSYPDIDVVVERGVANPNDGEAIASAIITQNPMVQAIYAPWDSIAEGVVSAARAAGRKDIKVFTMDLGANNALDMVKGGNIKGVVADLPYEMGRTMAKMGAKSLLDEKMPPFVVVPAIKVTQDNIKTQWKRALQRDVPKEVMDVLNK